jgi:putative flippase GtrA
MAFLTKEQKDALGPFLHIGIFLIAVAAGIAVNTVMGGPKVPVISEFSAIILGVIVGLVVHKQISK